MASHLHFAAPGPCADECPENESLIVAEVVHAIRVMHPIAPLEQHSSTTTTQKLARAAGYARGGPAVERLLNAAVLDFFMALVPPLQDPWSCGGGRRRWEIGGCCLGL